MSSSSVTSTGGSEDEAFWEEYLQKVTDEDVRLINRWQKVLDTLLIYIGLFIGVLTAFIIQVSNMFQPGSEDASNKVLYNHTGNTSSSIRPEHYTHEGFDSMVSSRILLLYTSLAISITEAALALIISVWLTRYQRSLGETGPTIHERIKKRHERHTGLIEWRLPILIEILPMVALVALALFALFISNFIRDVYPRTGDTLDNIFIVAALLFVTTASVAAFIPAAPFHSPLSSFIRFIFRIFPNRSIRGVIRIRTICVTLMCGASLALSVHYKIRLPFVIRVGLRFLFPVSILSLCQRNEAEKKSQEQPKPRLFSLATWCYFHAIVITALFVMLVYLRPVSRHFTIVYFSLSSIMMASATIIALRMSRWKTDEGKTKAEAIVWTIKTQTSRGSHTLVAFRNAVEIARNYAHLRSTLLEDILPVLDALIKSIQGVREQDLKDEEKIYITLLAILVDFEPSKASFWRNEAAVKRPVLSNDLKEKLRILRNGGCAVHSSPPHSGCAKAEAEFILGKVGREDGVEKESAQAV